MTLEEAMAAAQARATVIYIPGGDVLASETGVVTGTSETMALVRYGSDQNAKATAPADLEFAFVNEAMLARATAKAGGTGPRGASMNHGASFSNGQGGPRWLLPGLRPYTIWDGMEGRPYE